MTAPEVFEYALVRVVPRVERGEGGVGAGQGRGAGAQDVLGGVEGALGIRGRPARKLIGAAMRASLTK